MATLAVVGLAGCSTAAAGGGTGSGATATTTATTTTTATAPPGTTATPSAPDPTTHAEPVTVLGLGDSVMAGTGCDCAPFLDRYARALAKRDRLTVTPTDLGANGLTAADLVDQLDGADLDRQVAAADTVVLTVGANDLVPLVDIWEQGGCGTSCITPLVDRMRANMAAVLARLAQLGPAGQQVLVTDYWNVYEDGDVADAERGDGFAGWSDSVTRRANEAICSAVAAAGDTCVDLYRPFLGSDGTRNPTTLLADDGDHPNDAGHQLIARTLLSATRPSGKVG